MNKVLIYLLVLLFINSSYGQSDNTVLMTVNGRDVSVSEFKYIYEKNNGKEADYSKKSVEEYLDLYTKFKLKVEKARELQLDTITALKEELAGYKRQLANSYLMDKEVTDHLVKQLYDRMSEDVHVAHIMISLKETAPEKDWDNALILAKTIRQEIEKGKSFEKAVQEYSQDKISQSKNGDLGFFTAMMPNGFHELESAMYETPIGSISQPVRTKLGFHIVKVLEKRPARGQVEVAHILIRKKDVKSDTKAEIEEAYKKLTEGVDFAEIAAQYSQDPNTAKNGGLLKPFGIGTYDNVFETAAFGLTKVGEISKPLETNVGWHIIKLVNKIDPRADSYAQFKKINEPRIKKDGRYEAERINLINDIKKASGYKESVPTLTKFKAMLNEDFLTYKWSPEIADPLMEKEILSIGGNFSTTVKEFAEYCKKNTRTRLRFDKSQTTPSEVVDVLMADFSNEKAIEFEQSNLEMKYPDFKALMREYEEGILLFEATKQAVWDKANQDSVGLESFYAMHDNDYMTDEKSKVVTFAINTTDKNTAEKVLKFAEKNDTPKVLKKFNKKEAIVSYQEETLEKGNPKMIDMNWTVGNSSNLELNPKTNVYQFRKITEVFPARPKTLKEARGYVVADYQDYLEKQWVDSLRKSYVVKLNNNVLSQLIK